MKAEGCMTMYKVINHHTNEGWRTALVIKVGRKWTHLVYYEHPIRIKRVLNTEPLKHLTGYDQPRNMKYAVKTVHRMARAYYLTERNIPKSVKKVYNIYFKMCDVATYNKGWDKKR